MTWEEAKTAFKKQVPVTFGRNGGVQIYCSRIYEVGLRAVNGGFVEFVAAMDKNENAVYYGSPEQFSVTEEAERRETRYMMGVDLANGKDMTFPPQEEKENA